MKFGYARVSTKDQKLDRQIYDLEAYGCDRVYVEKKSGTDINKRTELERLLDNLRKGDTIVISDLTRLSRSLKDLFAIIKRIEDAGADIVSLKEAWLDTSTPYGKMMFAVFGCLAEFERDIIAQNTREGLQRARERGHMNGRPRLEAQKVAIALDMKKKGFSTADIAHATGIARSTIYKYLDEEKQKDDGV